MTLNDRSLLERLAQQLGYLIHWTSWGPAGDIPHRIEPGAISAGPVYWNPLREVGHAAALATLHEVSVVRIARGWRASRRIDGVAAFKECYDSTDLAPAESRAFSYCESVCTLLVGD